jgi:hypothetical protein
MHHFIVYLDLPEAREEHPVLAKLSTLRALRGSRLLWFVEYSPGAEVLYDFLRASLLEGDRLMVQPMNTALLGSFSRTVHTWTAGLHAEDPAG